jgi:hypothetical protein
MTEPRSGAPEGLPSGDDEIDGPDAEPIEADTAVEGDLTAGEADEVAEPDVDEDRTVGAPVRERRGRAARDADRRRAATPLTPSEQAVHIDDRISKLFVAGAVLVFVLIFLNAALLGRGGALSPAPTPTPTPASTASPTPSASASASVSASPSASASASGSASPATTPSPTP